MQKRTLAVIFGAFSILTPSIALGAAKTFIELVSNFIDVINITIPIIISAAVVLYMKNTATGLYNMKSGKVDPDWQKTMLWGIIIITLMVSLWGILSILTSTFFGSGF